MPVIIVHDADETCIPRMTGIQYIQAYNHLHTLTHDLLHTPQVKKTYTYAGEDRRVLTDVQKMCKVTVDAYVGGRVVL